VWGCRIAMCQRARGQQRVIRVVLQQAQERCHSEADVIPATSVAARHAGPPLLQRSTTMQDHTNSATGHAKRIPWNKGKLPAAKPPLRPKHVWAIRTKLQVEGRKRDLALFNLAVDSKLRGCDIVSIRVGASPSQPASSNASISLQAVHEGFSISTQTCV